MPDANSVQQAAEAAQRAEDLRRQMEAELRQHGQQMASQTSPLEKGTGR